MLQRGKRSATSLAVVAVLPGQRHKPPSYLTKPQKDVWKAVVATKPADWFTQDTHPLLVAYCRHVCTADALSVEIDTRVAALADLAEYEKLLKMREREVASAVRLATAMRLTQHSRLKAETAATQANNAGDADKPWARQA